MRANNEFTIFTESAEAVNVGKKQRPGSAGSNKRPSSANAAGRGGGRKPGEAAGGGVVLDSKGFMRTVMAEETSNYSLMSREALLLELTETKKKIRVMEHGTAQLKAEVQRLESEVYKQQQKIDRLLDPAAAGKNGQSSAEARKELEKSMIVRQLKQQMMQLRVSVAERDAELEAYRRSAKSSNLVELTTEREEYFLETQRLKQMVRELKAEMQIEKKARREWGVGGGGGGGGGRGFNGHHLAGTAGNATTTTSVEEELRREVARLASGYHDILSGMTTNINSSNNNFGGGGEQKRPASAGLYGSYNSNNNNNNDDEAGQHQQQQQQKMRPKSAAAAAASFEIPPFGPSSAAKASASAAGASSTSTSSRNAATTAVASSSSPAPAPAPAPSSSSSSPAAAATTTVAASAAADIATGTAVRAVKQQRQQLAVVHANNNNNNNNNTPLAAAASTSTTTTAAAVVAAAVAADDNVNAFSSSSSSSQLPVPPFQVGQRVEGMFRGGSLWYASTVKSITLLQGQGQGQDSQHSAEWSLHLLYDDGDEERNTPLERVRAMFEQSKKSNSTMQQQQQQQQQLQPQQTTPAAVAAPSATAIPTQSLQMAEEVAAKTVAVLAQKSIAKTTEVAAVAAAVTTTLAPPSPAPAPTAAEPSSNSSTSSSKQQQPQSQAQAQALFAVGEKVSACYYSGQSWYPATVQVRAREKNAGGVAIGWVYDLLYDDGDKEKRVKEANMKKVEVESGSEVKMEVAAANDTAQASSSSSSSSAANKQDDDDNNGKRIADMANNLRNVARQVLRGKAEYKKAFSAMAASRGGGGTSGIVAGFHAFAEDMLGGVKLTSLDVSSLLKHVSSLGASGSTSGVGTDKLTESAFVSFMLGNEEMGEDEVGEVQEEPSKHKLVVGTKEVEDEVEEEEEGGIVPVHRLMSNISEISDPLANENEEGPAGQVDEETNGLATLESGSIGGLDAGLPIYGYVDASSSQDVYEQDFEQ